MATTTPRPNDKLLKFGPFAVIGFFLFLMWGTGMHTWEIGALPLTVGSLFIWHGMNQWWENHPSLQKAPLWVGFPVIAALFGIGYLIEGFEAWLVVAAIGLGIGWFYLHRLLSDAQHAHFAPAVVVVLGQALAMAPFYWWGSSTLLWLCWVLFIVYLCYGVFHIFVAFAPVEQAIEHMIHHDDQKVDGDKKDKDPPSPAK
jgi:hypothetical protein